MKFDEKSIHVMNLYLFEFADLNDWDLLSLTDKEFEYLSVIARKIEKAYQVKIQMMINSEKRENDE